MRKNGKGESESNFALVSSDLSSQKSGNESTHARGALKKCFRIHFQQPGCIRSVSWKRLTPYSPGSEMRGAGCIVGNSEAEEKFCR